MPSSNAKIVDGSAVNALLGLVLATALGGCVGHYQNSPRYYSRPRPNSILIPEQRTFRVKLNDTLDSGTRTIPRNIDGDRFTATVVTNVYGSGRLALPKGTVVNGHVVEVKRFINRTSMRLGFHSARLPDGRTVVLNAEPKAGSGLDFSKVEETIQKEGTEFLIQKGIDAVTAGVLAPLWLAQKVVKGYGFVTKEQRMVLPKGAIIEVELKAPAYVPKS